MSVQTASQTYTLEHGTLAATVSQ